MSLLRLSWVRGWVGGWVRGCVGGGYNINSRRRAQYVQYVLKLFELLVAACKPCLGGTAKGRATPEPAGGAAKLFRGEANAASAGRRALPGDSRSSASYCVQDSLPG